MPSHDSSPGPVYSGNSAATSDAETLAFLNRLSSATLGLSDPEEIIAIAEKMLGEHMDVSRVLVAEATDDGEHVNVHHTWEKPGMPDAKGLHRIDDYGERILKDYRAGRMHIRRNAELENPPGPELEKLRAVGAMAAIDVPVLIDGVFRVLFVVHQDVARDWTEGEVTLLRQVADRTAAEFRRARAMQEVQESELHFRQMADSMPQIVWAANESGVPYWFNRRWHEYTRFPEGHLSAEQWHGAFMEEDLPVMLGGWEEAQRECRPHSVEVRLRRADDGCVRWHLARANPVTGPNGKVSRWFGTLTDIHDEKLASERERSNLAAIIGKAPAFICVLRGPEHQVEMVNEKYRELIGRPVGVGMPIRELLPDIEGQGFFQMLDEVYETGESQGGTEVPVVMGPEGDRRTRYVNFIYQALLGADKKPEGVFVHGVDVTDSVLAREAVATSERRRRMALEAAQIGSFNINLMTKKVVTNERFRKLIGFEGEELSFGDGMATVHPDDVEKVTEAIAAATRAVDPEPYVAEYRVVHPDGSVHWMSARGGVTFGEGPEGMQPVSFDGTMTDITAKKVAEEELAFQRHLLEIVFRESPAEMALWRGEDLVFEKVNPPYQALFGDRQLIGRTVLEAIPELKGQGFDDKLREVMLHGVPVIGREVLARIAKGDDASPEDHYFDFTYLQVRDTEGKPYGVFDHSVDVTDRVLARRELEESREQLREALADRQALLDAERAARAEAEVAGRMKDEFLATLSHELRTPLNAIVGWTHLLQMMPDHKRLEEGLAVISRNAKAQTQIIEDILDMSRIVSGKLRLNVQSIDLPSIVRAGVETVQTAADAKGVRLQQVLDSSAHAMVGDSHRLQQVFWNLLSNAVKFTPKGGRILVTLKRINSHVEVSVTDTGDGIEPEFLPHVFDRFRQADASTTRYHGGLGLGLAIVKQIVELHGGSVKAFSPGKGEGATFTVQLPVAIHHPAAAEAKVKNEVHPAVAADEPVATIQPGQLAGVSIVAVDDEADAVGFVERLLTDCGAVVRTATSTAAAFELVKRHSPDVIVSDIGMPGEDGYAFMRRVRELPAAEGGRAKALAVTAYARSVDRVRALESGFQMHIAKPVDPAELIACVAALGVRE